MAPGWRARPAAWRSSPPWRCCRRRRRASAPAGTPGLPYLPCDTDFDPLTCEAVPELVNDYGWLNLPQNGLTGAVKAKQWARIPVSMLAAGSQFRIDPVQPDPDAGIGSGNDSTIYTRAFFVSPRGSSDNYGESMPIRVRTLAFGSVPAEITLQVGQRRDAQGLPIPFELLVRNSISNYELPDGTPNGSLSVIYPTRIDERVRVRVTRLVVDGVDVGLGSTCSTGPTARLLATSQRWEVRQEPDYVGGPTGSKADDTFDPADPTNGVYALYGGTLQGKVDVPAFRGCGTRTGDDVSALLTAAISGPGNPLTIRLGAQNCTAFDDQGRGIPTKPGQDTPRRAGCAPSDTSSNPNLSTVPKPITIPDTSTTRVE